MNAEDPLAGAPAPIATLKKNRREELRFSLDTFKGHCFVSVRIFAPNRDGTAMLPTRAGVTFKPELISEVRAALDKTEQQARALGLLPDG